MCIKHVEQELAYGKQSMVTTIISYFPVLSISAPTITSYSSDVGLKLNSAKRIQPQLNCISRETGQ